MGRSHGGTATVQRGLGHVPCRLVVQLRRAVGLPREESVLGTLSLTQPIFLPGSWPLSPWAGERAPAPVGQGLRTPFPASQGAPPTAG